MKPLMLLFFITLLSETYINGQSRLDSLYKETRLPQMESKLDSLKSIEQDYQKKIVNIRKETSIIENEIKALKLELSKGDIYICRFTSILTKDPGVPETIATIKGSEKVKVIDQNEKYLQVDYNGVIGWTERTGFISLNEKIQLEKRIEKQKIDLALEDQKIISDRKTELTKKFGASNAQKIIDGKIWLGMTSEMAKESWGQPKKINRDVYEFGKHEQWIYQNTYLYFEDDILKSWQER